MNETGGTATDDSEAEKVNLSIRSTDMDASLNREDHLESDGSDDDSRENKLISRIKWGLVEGHGSENWKNRIRKTYEEDRRKGLFLVAKVVTSDGDAFPVDKAILMASSGYFNSVFSNHRAPNCHQLAIIIPTWLNITGDVFRHILDLIFTRKITNPPLEILADFVRACRDLEVHNSVECLTEWMTSSVQARNCVNFWRIARDNALDGVRDSLFSFVLANIEAIPMETIRGLTYKELVSFISHDRANIRREETTMKIIAQWILSLNSQSERNLRISQLILLVRFGNAATGYIPRLLLGQDIPELSTLFSAGEIVIYLRQVHSVLLAIQADPSPARYDIYAYPFLRPRIPHDLIFIFGGYVGSSPCKLLETYDSRVNKWFKTDANTVLQRSYHGMVYLNGLIYLVGGFDGNQQLRTLSLIDPVRKRWMNKSSMNQARCYVAVTEHRGKIYACGGFNGRVRHRSCELYDPQTDSWTEIAPMNEIRSDATAVATKDRIYVIGGFDGHQVHNSIEFYDENSGKWQYLAQPMVISRSGVNSVVWQEKIIVIGGNSGHHRENTVEIYDINRASWSFLPNLNTTRSNFAACVMEDTLYVLGGYDGFGTTNNCESLDLRRIPESKWTTVWPLSSSRSALSACVISGLPDAKQYSWLRKELEVPVPTIERED